MPVPCKWCGADLKKDAAAFCSECKGPQNDTGTILYGLNFFAKTLAIPLAIAVVTLILTNYQQDAALIVANRQKLAEALGEVGKVQADYHLADSQIALMASAKDDTVPAKDLRDAVLRLDLAIASFGAKLGPFEEFARRTKYYEIEPGQPSPLQLVWDRCFVKPYWGDERNKGYLSDIRHNLSKCDENKCPRAAAQEIRANFDKFYQGYCYEGKPKEHLDEIWFNRELRRISIQEPHSCNAEDPFPCDLYKVGEQ
jgi:hypothetical protein